MSAVGRYRVERVAGGVRTQVADEVAVEEPLEIRIAGCPPWLTMRTPGDDIDLALGWLVSEGAITTADEVLSAQERSGGEGLDRATSVEVTLRPGIEAPLARAYAASSSCGVCGSDTNLDVLSRCTWPLNDVTTTVDAATLLGFPEQLRAAQRGFGRTGGLHAAALFVASTGERLHVREDVGRHNAVDKVIGWALRAGRLPGFDLVLQVSSRASFELVQKAATAGIPILSSVSAPTSMAIELARATNLTLACFVRGTTFNLYSGSARIAGAP
ncbi:MAG: formate dehydrogenase accessory sulfurtransferase FdhD [Actinomycetota bacterium]|nr:formate dehydrogenase accessory sulfurtransferase FdhD [Actinomycetota bacterium]